MRHTLLMCLTSINSETEGSIIANKLCESNKRNGINALGCTPVIGGGRFKKEVLTLSQSHIHSKCRPLAPLELDLDLVCIVKVFFFFCFSAVLWYWCGGITAWQTHRFWGNSSNVFKCMWKWSAMYLKYMRVLERGGTTLGGLLEIFMHRVTLTYKILSLGV